MPKRENEFEHESLQNRRSIIAHLKSLQKGFESGRLTISDPDGTIELLPGSLIRLEVHALQKREHVRLTVQFEWKKRSKDEVFP